MTAPLRSRAVSSYAPPLFGRGWWIAVTVAAVAAGVLATAVQVVLWIAFTDAWPGILWRDARLAAAVVLGPAVLPPATGGLLAVLAVATAVHFALSYAYAAAVGVLAARLSHRAALAAGAAFGLALYVVNMHGFTAVWPWFAQARDWITVAAHLAFGLIAADAFVRTRRRFA